MSDTPKTDNETDRADGFSVSTKVVCVEFARRLERENAKLRAALERIRDEVLPETWVNKIAKEALTP